jgi:hypothetical protein
MIRPVQQDSPLDVENVRARIAEIHPRSITLGVERRRPPAGYREEFPRAGILHPQLPDGSADQNTREPRCASHRQRGPGPDERDVQGWGDSVLQAVDEAIRAASATIANVAAWWRKRRLISSDAGVDEELLDTDAYEDRLTRRFTYVNSAQSIINARLMDKEEKWVRHETNFAGLPDIVKLYLMIASGALDIPATRFLSQSPARYERDRGQRHAQLL